jgi:membrane protease YdiL (CAAX protease family)
MISDDLNPPPVEVTQASETALPSHEAGAATGASANGEMPLDQPAAAASPPLPEDIRVPWDWIDLVIFALLSLGGTFIVSIALVFAFNSILHVSAAQLRSSPSLRTYFAILNQVILSFALIGFMALQIRTRAPMPFWRTLGWRRLDTGRVPKPLAIIGLIAAGTLLSMFVEFTSSLNRPKTKLPIEAFFQDRRSALLLMIVSVVFAPFLEETIFRGYIYPGLARSFGIRTSIIATGTLFGLLHAPQLWGGWTQIALLVLVGILFTYARAATRTVVTSYLLHLSYNSFLFLAFLISSHWLRAVPRH